MDQQQTRAMALDELKRLLGDRLSVAKAVREQHASDESWHAPVLPDAVAFVHSTDEVSDVLQICHRHGVPVIPFRLLAAFRWT